MPQTDAIFEEHRPTLERLAYRMLGSLADADDVLQEAYLRWTRADHSEVKSAKAYLNSIVTRLCIDQRRTVEARKESYVGPWLPEPVIEVDRPDRRLEAAETVSLAFLVVLEHLSPVERAAYLLKRVFDYGYDEIAGILDKSEPACRQLVSRAEERIRERRPRFDPDPNEAERVTSAFMETVSTGDMDGLVSLLAADAAMYADSGGKVPAALMPVIGAERVARFFLGLMKKAPSDMEIRRVRVNGQPGLMALSQGQIINVLTFDIAAGRIAACYVIRNPEKLSRIEVNGSKN